MKTLWRYKLWWLGPIILVATGIIALVVLGEGGDVKRLYPDF